MLDLQRDEPLHQRDAFRVADVRHHWFNPSMVPILRAGCRGRSGRFGRPIRSAARRPADRIGPKPPAGNCSAPLPASPSATYNPRSICSCTCRRPIPPSGRRLRQPRARPTPRLPHPATPPPGPRLPLSPRPFRCSRRCPSSSRVCLPRVTRRAPRAPAGSADALALAQLAATLRRRRSDCSRSSAPMRSPRSGWPTRCPGSRPGCASRSCPTGKRCRTTSSRRTRTSSRSGSRRSTTCRAANATCSSSRRRRRCYRLAPPEYLAAFTFFLKQGDAARRRRACARSSRSPATRTSRRSSRPASSACAAGSIDLFPMGRALPYRLDLFDDEIESISTFDVDTQRTLYPVPDVRLLPAREFPLDEAGRTRFRSALPRGVRRRSVEVRRCTRT